MSSSILCCICFMVCDQSPTPTKSHPLNARFTISKVPRTTAQTENPWARIHPSDAPASSPERLVLTAHGRRGPAPHALLLCRHSLSGPCRATAQSHPHYGLGPQDCFRRSPLSAAELEMPLHSTFCPSELYLRAISPKEGTWARALQLSPAPLIS